MRQCLVTVSAVVWFVATAAADPVAGPVTSSPPFVESFESAMARIEARVLQFAGSGGVVEQYIEPYESMILPDPQYLIEFNRTLAVYWTKSVDEAVDDFIESQAFQASLMYMASPDFIGWNPVDVVPDPSETVSPQDVSGSPGDRAASRSTAAIHRESAFDPDVSKAPGPETDSGFFGEQ